jgi:hypothetical protein
MTKTHPTKVGGLVVTLVSLNVIMVFAVIGTFVEISEASKQSFSEGAVLVQILVATGASVAGLGCAVVALRALPRTLNSPWHSGSSS